MTNTGIVRRTDDLSRIVLLKEIRRSIGIEEGDPLSISVSNESIILTPYVNDIETQLLRIKRLYSDFYGYNSKKKNF